MLLQLRMLATNVLLTKGTLRLGSHMLLTKPLGFGVTVSAHNRGLISDKVLAEVIGCMKSLNRAAGGLAVPDGKLGTFKQSAEASAIPIWEIGTVKSGEGIQVLG
ncbi:MAG: hypothetical protein GYA40_04000 [Chloroflexi bacterium]|nr:hypothetical protein [Chloroflexota bacterium]